MALVDVCHFLFDYCSSCPGQPASSSSARLCFFSHLAAAHHCLFWCRCCAVHLISLPHFVTFTFPSPRINHLSLSFFHLICLSLNSGVSPCCVCAQLPSELRLSPRPHSHQQDLTRPDLTSYTKFRHDCKEATRSLPFLGTQHWVAQHTISLPSHTILQAIKPWPYTKPGAQEVVVEPQRARYTRRPLLLRWIFHVGFHNASDFRAPNGPPHQTDWQQGHSQDVTLDIIFDPW